MGLIQVEKGAVFARLQTEGIGDLIYNVIVPRPDGSEVDELPLSYFDDLSVIVALAKLSSPSRILELCGNSCSMAPVIALNVSNCSIFTTSYSPENASSFIEIGTNARSNCIMPYSPQSSLDMNNFDIIIQAVCDEDVGEALNAHSAPLMSSNKDAAIIWRGCNAKTLEGLSRLSKRTGHAVPINFISDTSLCVYYPNK